MTEKDGLTGVRKIFEERISNNGLFEIQSWVKTFDPVPPKDWKPRCFGRCFKLPSDECSKCEYNIDNACIKEHDRLRVLK